MKYLLLTGATGLLGEYLLRDLTRLGCPLAVIARSSGRRSAADRIEDIFAKLERVERRAMPRPIVLEGDLQQPLLGLSPAACDWVRGHCDELLHNAASLQFIEDPRSGEPYRSNVQGTAEMLALCETTGIKHLHHVSTAYVCGNRRGRILETDALDLAAAGNDYEASKIQSELMVRECAALESRVIYRPAIIVGDHRTGYTSTFHGFYVPLQLSQAMRTSGHAPRGLPPEMVMSTMGLSGEEQKNFVPVDWISAAISRGVTDQSGRFRGRTIHLAPSKRVSLAAMSKVIAESLETQAGEQQPGATSSSAPSATRDPSQVLDFFRQQMGIYQAYWRDDPEFDGTAVAELLPDLPCPEVDHQSMLRLCRYALRTNFGARRGLPPVHPSRVGETLGAAWQSSTEATGEAEEHGTNASGGQVFRLGCCITGPGGGDFTLQIPLPMRPTSQSPADVSQLELLIGLPTESRQSVRFNRPTLDALLAGTTTIDACLRRGQIMLFHAAAAPQTDPLPAKQSENEQAENERLAAEQAASEQLVGRALAALLAGLQSQATDGLQPQESQS